MSSPAKIAAIALLFIFTWIVLRFAFAGVDAILMRPLADSLGWPFLEHVSSFWLVLLVLLVLPSRLTSIPKALEIRGTIEIEAAPETIWATIGPFPHDPYWGAAITHTTAVPGEPNRIDFHFDNGPDGQTWGPLQAVIEADVPDEYFAYTYQNADAFPLMGQDLILSEFFLEPISGGTRVTQIEHLCRIRLTTIPLLLFLNPSRDALKRLKAVVEGHEDKSWMGQTARNLAEEP